MWENCHNKCSFCFQCEKNQLDDLQKKQSIEATIDFINDENRFKRGSHVLLVGGELFDSPSIFKDLKKLIDFVIEKLTENYIDLLYVNTNLIYKNLDGVRYLLDSVDKYNLFERLKFTTSYDVAGRFANQKVEKLMLDNLTSLTTNYQKLNVVVNSMLSKQLCQQIIDHQYSINHFREQYRCDVNLIPYIVYDQQLAGSRKQIFTALSIIGQQDPIYLERYISNFDLHQDKLLYQYKDHKYSFVSCGNSKCGHSENFKRYSTNNSCFICDLKTMFNK